VGRDARLRVGPYRIMYTVEGDLITILRVDRRAAG
jgi:mRNA-degrading endonuclease RelE of RelBE toxin-antitoxin system